MSKHSYDICPVCGGQINIWAKIEYENIHVVKNWGCPNCKATGKSLYELKFIAHGEIKEDEHGQKER